MYDDPDCLASQEEKTMPSPLCEGTPGCPETVEVLFLRTGQRMCSRHALTALYDILNEGRDTDKAPPDGSPTLPPLPDHE